MGGGVKKLPFEKNEQQSTTNTFGWQSMPQDNPFVQAFMNTPTMIDPGARQRTDLEEQDNENRWNSAFMSGVPEQVRMMNRDASQRGIRQQGVNAQQQARYQQGALDLQKYGQLLPQLTQTGGTSTGKTSGYESQMGKSIWGDIIGAGGQIGGAAIIA